MNFFRMGSRIKNRSFDFIPRYYDPAKEELEGRIKGYNQNIEATEIAKSRIRRGFRSSSAESREYAQNVRKRSNYRLLGIVVFLVLLSFLVLSKFLPQIVEMVEK